MQSFEQQLAVYEAQHLNPTSRIAHYIGISAIFIGLIILLNWFILDIFARWHINLAWLFIIGVLVFYYLLRWRLALVATVILIIITGIISWLVPPAPTKLGIILFLILFVGGCALQYYGQSIAKNVLTIKNSIMQIIISPLFFILKLVNVLKINDLIGI